MKNKFYFCKMDIWTEAKIRSLTKQKRREKRNRQDSLIEHLDEDMKKKKEKEEQKLKQKRINELIQTIKALQIINADTTKQREELKQLLTPA